MTTYTNNTHLAGAIAVPSEETITRHLNGAMDPAIQRVLSALRQRLEQEPDFCDGAVTICFPMSWLDVDESSGAPPVTDQVLAAAELRLRREPGWIEILEAFVGGESSEVPTPTAGAHVPARSTSSPQSGAGPDGLAAALRYAAMGWPVLPLHGVKLDGSCTCRRGAACESVGKHPRTREGLKEATIDAERITEWFRRWPSANIGILTGATSGLIALDVDPRHGGDGSLEELQRLHGRLPATLTASTGGGGRHLLYRHPGGRLRNATNLGGLSGLDVRADGGYLVAEPSVHASGRIYTWLGDASTESVAQAPGWLNELLASPPRRHVGTDGAITSGDDIPTGGRNDALFRLGCSLRAQGREREDILAELSAVNVARCRPPLDEAEVEGIAASAAIYEAGASGGRTAEAHLELVAPLPEGAAEPDTEHPRLGPAVSIHTYRDADGQALWHACAFWAGQSLTTRPMTLWREACQLIWRWKGPPVAPRPLFALPELLALPDAPLLVVASEAAAERAARAFPGWAVTCPMFGANGVSKADWVPAAGRQVLVWAADTDVGTTFSRLTAAALRRAGAARVVAYGCDKLPGDAGELRAADGRVDGGDAPSPESGWTPAHLHQLLDRGAQAAPDRLEQIALLRDNENELPVHRRDRAVAEALVADLLRTGRIYREGDIAYVFIADERRLVEVDQDGRDCALMLARYGINRAEPLYRYAVHHLWAEAMTRGIETEVRYLSHYDRQRNAIYVYNQGGLVYRVTTMGIETVENGTDGVLFLGEPRAEPFTLVDGFDPAETDDEGLNPITKHLTDGLNLAPGLLTREDAQMLLMVWIYALFVPELMPTKPILALVGPKGSSKTALALSIGLVLFGRNFAVTKLTADERDFDAAASSSALLVLDNVDAERSWLPDKLATLATGGQLLKRALYTTNRVAAFRSRSWVAITSRTPPFKRDDVAERLLLLHTQPRDGFVPEGEVERRTLQQRDLLMTNLLHELVWVVEAMREHGGATIVADFRMADYYALAVRVARHLGSEAEMVQAFRRLKRAQGAFAIDDDPAADLIGLWLQRDGNAGREIKATELFGELTEISRSHRTKPPRETSPMAFSQHLAAILSALRERYHVETWSRKKTAVYVFRPLSGE